MNSQFLFGMALFTLAAQLKNQFFFSVLGYFTAFAPIGFSPQPGMVFGTLYSPHGIFVSKFGLTDFFYGLWAFGLTPVWLERFFGIGRVLFPPLRVVYPLSGDGISAGSYCDSSIGDHFFETSRGIEPDFIHDPSIRSKFNFVPLAKQGGVAGNSFPFLHE